MDAGDSPPRLIVGLGNPGGKYAETRHNVGFMVVDALAQDAATGFDNEKRWQTQIAKDGSRYLLKPQTFMNESGIAVGAVASFYKIDPAQVLVIYDDLDLELGRLRLRPGGSAGGHNGMKSIIAHLGTQKFPRLRVGIGRQGGGTISHVLGKFREDERSELEKSLKNALLAIRMITAEGLSAAMTRFNATAPKPKQEPKPKKNNTTGQPAESEPPAESNSES